VKKSACVVALFVMLLVLVVLVAQTAMAPGNMGYVSRGSTATGVPTLAPPQRVSAPAASHQQVLCVTVEAEVAHP
jgi:hypothetical protein